MEDIKSISARISVADAAKLMDCTPLFLRVALQQGVFDFGECIRMSGSKKCCYYINKNKLLKYLAGD